MLFKDYRVVCKDLHIQINQMGLRLGSTLRQAGKIRKVSKDVRNGFCTSMQQKKKVPFLYFIVKKKSRDKEFGKTKRSPEIWGRRACRLVDVNCKIQLCKHERHRPL